MFSAVSVADEWDQTPRDVLDVRAYPDGSFVFRFSPALSGSSCQFPDTTYTPNTAPAYKTISSLALTAYTSHRKVLLIYNGCANGNVNVTGLTLPQQ